MVYFNSSKYEFGQNESEEFHEQELKNYQLRIINHQNSFFKKLIYGFHYSTGIGANYLTQYNFSLGLISEPIERVNLKMYLDYRIKYLGTAEKSTNDFFFRTSINYDIK